MIRYFDRCRHNAWRILFIPLSTLWQRILWCLDSKHHDRGAL